MVRCIFKFRFEYILECLRACLLWRIHVVKVITHICMLSFYWPISVGNRKVANSNVFRKNWNTMLLASEDQLSGEWCHYSCQNLFYKGMRSVFEYPSSFHNIIYYWMRSLTISGSKSTSDEDGLVTISEGIVNCHVHFFCIAQDKLVSTALPLSQRSLQVYPCRLILPSIILAFTEVTRMYMIWCIMQYSLLTNCISIELNA